MTPDWIREALDRFGPDAVLVVDGHEQRVGDLAGADPFADINRDLFGPPATEASEHEMQAAVFAWAAANAERYPDLKWLYAIPNGGARHPAVGAKMKAEGVKRGYPDIGWDIARGCYHGLRIEMKTKRGRLTPEQAAWFDRLHKQGYFCAVCYSVRQATDVLEWYAGLEA